MPGRGGSEEPTPVERRAAMTWPGAPETGVRDRHLTRRLVVGGVIIASIEGSGGDRGIWMRKAIPSPEVAAAVAPLQSEFV